MKKFLAVIIFVLGIFILRGFYSGSVLAADSAVVGGELNNSAGTIPITVTVNYYHSGGWFDSDAVTVAAGAKTWVYSKLDTPDLGNVYSADWRTDCTDPPVQATYQGTWGDGIGPGVAAYEFASQDVACRTTNSEPEVTNSTCTSGNGQVDWRLIGVGSNGPNVDYFYVFKSQTDSTPETNPELVDFTNSTSPYSHSKTWSGLALGVWYIRVSAVSPQSSYSRPAYSNFNCGQAISAAGSLNASTSCVAAGGPVKVSFTWNTATGTTFDDQWLDLSLVNDNFVNRTYQSNYQVLPVNTQSYTITNAATSITYYWRINTHAQNGLWYTSTTVRFTTPSCPSATISLTSSVACSGTTARIGYSISIPDGVNTALIISKNSDLSNPVVVPAPTFSSNSTYTYTPSAGTGRYYAQLNRFVFVGNKVSNNMTSSSVIDGVDCAGSPATSPSPEPPAPAYIEIYIFQDSNGDGLKDVGESSVRLSDAPGMSVKINGTNVYGPLDFSGLTYYEKTFQVISDTYYIYFQPDAKWQITKYSHRDPDQAFYITGNYVDITPPGGSPLQYYTDQSVGPEPGQTWRVRLGVQPKTPPTGDIKANSSDGPIWIASSTSATISWSSTNATSCSVDPTGWTGTANAGISTGNLTASVTYTLTCTNTVGSGSDAVIVNVSTITLSGFSDCVDGVNAYVHLTWSSNTDNTGYEVRMDSSVLGSVGGSARSWDSGPNPGSGTHSWQIRGIGGSAGAVTSNTINITQAVCGAAPANPSNLTATAGCDASNKPTITFAFLDNANNETGFWLDVNAQAWTGPTGPSPWAVKTLGASTGVGATATFVWSETSVLDSGDVDPVTAGEQKVPTKNTTYYWRIKAFNSDRQSEHVYPPNSTFWPGQPIKTLGCGWDLSVSLVPGYNQRYLVNETLTATVRVTNSTVAQVASPAIASNGLGVWPKNGSGTMPACTATPSTPGAGNGNSTGYAIGAINPGGIADINISFDVGSTIGTFTAYIYVVPTCSPADDSDWSNNGISLSYAIGTATWFQTNDGDVGAVGRIEVGVVPPPANQSTYLLAADSIVGATAPWTLNNYRKALVPSGGIYNWMASRFLEEAKKNTQSASPECNIPAGVQSGLVYCPGSARFQVGGSPKGNAVWFVEGNLIVESNLQVQNSNTDTIVFVVKGNITVNTSVTIVDGVYIAGGTFTDTDAAGGIVGNQLAVNGAVYANTISLSRVLASGNDTTPAEVINFKPQYLMALQNFLGSPSIAWKEIAP